MQTYEKYKTWLKKVIKIVDNKRLMYDLLKPKKSILVF